MNHPGYRYFPNYPRSHQPLLVSSTTVAVSVRPPGPATAG